MQTKSTWVGLLICLAAVAAALAWLVRSQVPAQSKEDTKTTSARVAEADMSTMPTARPRGKWRKLSAEEEHVIVHKGTERAFTGKYYDHHADGVYTCRRCGAALFRSEDKFDSGTGWPSFDDEIPGAVKRVRDADGMRTEIVCANCDGHLGHVFTGEGLTPKNIRHCTNSVSLDFVPAEKLQKGRAIFAGGCFWGVEYWLQKQPGVIETTVGYSGGTQENPTYESMHRSSTGHAEAVEVIYDPAKVSYEELAKLFFEIHDPTQRNGQGPDIGAEYRSAIFYIGAEQKRVAKKLIAELKARGMDIATQVVPAGKFWPGEDYHQDYYSQRHATPACHFRRELWPKEAAEPAES